MAVDDSLRDLNASDVPWQPSASLANLQRRSAMLTSLRRFFADRQVLEVETPLLARFSVTDPYMPVIRADHPTRPDGHYYLQTSPEYSMKRLLAAGSGAIFQICKAFRRQEQGRQHNSEFTLLEWYRPGWDYRQLIDEVEALVTVILGATQPFARPFARRSYRELFQRYCDIDPHLADSEQLASIARQHIDVQMHSENRDDWLNLLMSEVIEPRLAAAGPTFVVDYPATQAALANLAIDGHGQQVAQRFELYVDGVELANGYDELTDSRELAGRCEREQQQIVASGGEPRQADRYLLAAMAAGMPACAGVALGLDRLLMIALQAGSIDEVIAFNSERA